jgi:hypothetical protein
VLLLCNIARCPGGQRARLSVQVLRPDSPAST